MSVVIGHYVCHVPIIFKKISRGGGRQQEGQRRRTESSPMIIARSNQVQTFVFDPHDKEMRTEQYSQSFDKAVHIELSVQCPGGPEIKSMTWPANLVSGKL